MTHHVEALSVELGKFFPSCPLCQKEKAIRLQFHFGWSMKDYVKCSNCGARWLINDVRFQSMEGRTHIENLKWVKLIETGSSGKGESYLGTENEPAFWLNKIEKKPIKSQVKAEAERQQSGIRQPIVKEKETIIRETTTTYKVKCPYCKYLYDEALDYCPHCGGKRT